MLAEQQALEVVSETGCLAAVELNHDCAVRMMPRRAVATVAFALSSLVLVCSVLWWSVDRGGYFGDWNLDFAVCEAWGTDYLWNTSGPSGYGISNGSKEYFYLILRADTLSLSRGDLLEAQILVCSSDGAPATIDLPIDEVLIIDGSPSTLASLYSKSGTVNFVRYVSRLLGLGFGGCVLTTKDFSFYVDNFDYESSKTSSSLYSSLRTDLIKDDFINLLKETHGYSHPSREDSLMDYSTWDERGGYLVDSAKLRLNFGLSATSD